MDLLHIDTLDEPQIAQLHQLYQHEWWTRGRALDDVRRALRGSDLLFGVCEADSRRLVAFARVLTDGVFKALIFDVIVDAAYRGRGLGRLLLDRIVSHPDLADVRHIELYCHPDMAPFYERWDFSADLGALLFMRRSAGAPAQD